VPPVALRLDTYYYFNFTWLYKLILTEDIPLLTLNWLLFFYTVLDVGSTFKGICLTVRVLSDDKEDG